MAIKIKDIRVKLPKLMLDPDNYRVATKTQEHVSSFSEIKASQDQIFNMLKKQKLADLKDSILKNGFLTVDRIVVKKLDDNCYLVIEGNRRVAAFKSLIQDYENGFLEDSNISDLIEQSRAISAVLVEGSEDEIKDYSNALMGIRHVSGAKTWHGWQSAKLVNSMYEKGHTLTDIGLMLGISAIDAGRRMRGYKAFQQFESDADYGTKKETHHYALFLEFLASNKSAKKWLGWSEERRKFENIPELKRVYKAISKDDDGLYEVRNIDDAREFIKRLESPSGQKKIMEVENYEEIPLEDLSSNVQILNLVLVNLRSVSLDKLESKEERELIQKIQKRVKEIIGGVNE